MQKKGPTQEVSNISQNMSERMMYMGTKEMYLVCCSTQVGHKNVWLHVDDGVCLLFLQTEKWHGLHMVASWASCTTPVLSTWAQSSSLSLRNTLGLPSVKYNLEVGQTNSMSEKQFYWEGSDETVYLYKEGMAIAEKTDRKNAKFQLAMVCIKQATCVVNTRSQLLT